MGTHTHTVSPARPISDTASVVAGAQFSVDQTTTQLTEKEQGQT